MSGQSDGLTDTLISVMTAHATKSPAHALTVVSAIVEVLLLAMALILIIKRRCLEGRQQSPDNVFTTIPINRPVCAEDHVRSDQHDPC